MATVISVIRLFFAYGLSYATEYLPVIYLDNDPDLQIAEDPVNDLHQFELIKQRVAADDIHIALKELPVSPLLRSVGTPYRLYLVSPEREGDLIAVLYHISCERNGEVIPETLFADA